jgi:hypothetical protein
VAWFLSFSATIQRYFNGFYITKTEPMKIG